MKMISNTTVRLRDSLDDKYKYEQGLVWLSGIQALVKLPMIQKKRDQDQGLNTAGFVSGYRGSPLGGLDQHLWQAQAFLDKHNIIFKPGVNEDLAATAVWGTQQLNLYPQAKYDGVFSLWYGKGPGVDRSTDALKHANAAGSARFGGVVALAGDDHAARSSTLPHQSDHIFKASGIPVLYPSSVQECLDLGVHAWAMSRYSGAWVGMKCVTDIIESSASVDISFDRVQVQVVTDYELPAGGLNIRWPDTPVEQERRLLEHKLYAALAYARANRLNQLIFNPPRARFGIMTAGKAYLDTCQALYDLGLSAKRCEELGIRLFKVGMVWPLEPQSTREFAQDLDEIIVIEEKRQILEYQLKEELFAWIGSSKKIPRVIGKFDEKEGGEWSVPHSDWVLPSSYELNPRLIAKVIAKRLLNLSLPEDVSQSLRSYLERAQSQENDLQKPRAKIDRQPWFCSGCPHNTSTCVPEGSRALAGIGCHYMVLWMDRQTSTFTQMGGEGVPWIGQQAFTHEKHVFANLGDGTYFHSGYLAIRAAIAAKVPITYKILLNDAVAMTGGQAVDGTLTITSMVNQVLAEGVKKLVVVSDDPGQYGEKQFPDLVRIHHRDELDKVQRELRDYPDVSVLIYDQVCATEKRRRRKRGRLIDPPKRLVINPAVCEGCGDCSTQSNCLSIEPLSTTLGVKRQINQSSCNKDFSCLKGFCPSFVMLEGAELKSRKAMPSFPSHPIPDCASTNSTNPFYSVLVAGVGGTGVITLGQLIGMAAHIDGKFATVLDMTGLAQKGGAVFSHIVIANDAAAIHSTRVSMGGADLLLASDVVVAASVDVLSRLHPARTRAVINTNTTPTAGFITEEQWRLPSGAMQHSIVQDCLDSQLLEANALSVQLFGDSLYATAILLGYAYQRGYIPLALDALKQAIRLNHAAVEYNLCAFEWGRAYALDPTVLTKLSPEGQAAEDELFQVQSLDDLIQTHYDYLCLYQSPRYATTYLESVNKVRAVDRHKDQLVTRAACISLFKLMAIKDEYEVARLHADPQFWDQLRHSYEGQWKPRFYLAVPFLGGNVKREYGSYMLGWFRLLAKFKVIRGTVVDPFSYLAERKHERALLETYRKDLAEALPLVVDGNYDLILALLSLPHQIKGYGMVKSRSSQRVAIKRRDLWSQLLGTRS